ncbi:oligosaccharidyl-lipid flippase family [Clonorchis sinensis]|uniref:Man(5)GlcNAc(2)-PP-dolichol translocation protein RFT1 n=1 Tax=Clonorchis sinensis TaxID=79923 RepID=H2KUI4_CLOSI|nr:oligosaccharidyl-lipid flippase family [Clonorchis sinensis]
MSLVINTAEKLHDRFSRRYSSSQMATCDYYVVHETDVADMIDETPRRWQRFRSLKSAVRGCLSPPRNRTCCEFKGHNRPSDTESMPNPSTDSQTKTHSGARFVSTGFSLIGYTFFLQLGLHLMTFFLNGLAYHRLDTASLGLVNVRLGLFYTTLMFISRDAFRRAFLSRGGQLLIQADSSVAEDSEESVRLASRGRTRRPLSRLAGLIDLAWAISLASKHGEMMLPVEVLQERYVNCLLVYALSGLFELSTEPFWLICQLSHLIGSRIVIEALANLARAVGIAIAIFTVSSDYAIYSLALPQILHGTTLFVAYLIYFSYTLRKRGGDGDCGGRSLEGVHRFRDIFPRVSKYEIDRPALKLARSLFGQGLLKQLLTEGERYLISAFNLLSFTNQGIYDMVNNIGSIATRLLFLPMEESCHFVFNQCLVRNIPPNQQDPELLKSVFRIFRTVLRTCSLVAWIGVTFAQANSRLLLTVYVGPTLGENVLAVSLLRLYAAYVLLLAWNGSTEAFLNAAMSSHEVAKHNERLIIFSFVFLGANWLFVPWLGAHGFVVANCINMLSRITYSCYYINRFVTSTGSTPQTDECSLRSIGKDNMELESDSREAVCGFSLLRLMFPSVKESIALLLSLAVTLVSEPCTGNRLLYYHMPAMKHPIGKPTAPLASNKMSNRPFRFDGALCRMPAGLWATGVILLTSRAAISDIFGVREFALCTHAGSAAYNAPQTANGPSRLQEVYIPISQSHERPRSLCALKRTINSLFPEVFEYVIGAVESTRTKFTQNELACSTDDIHPSHASKSGESNRDLLMNKPVSLSQLVELSCCSVRSVYTFA